VKRPLTGIVPVLVTPMHRDGSPDEDGIHRLVEFLVNSGVGGLWVLGSAGEDINISWNDRVIVLKNVIAAAKNRIPVITGTGCTNVNDVLRFTEEIGGLELAGIHMLYMDPKPSDTRMIAEITRLADNCEYPIWLYHNPKRGKQVSVEVIRAVRDHENVIGMKVGGYSLSEMMQAVLHQTQTFQVMGAGGGQFFVMLCLGCQAHTSSDSCVWPEEFIKLHALFLQGKLEEAREQQVRLIKLNNSYPRSAFRDNGESSSEEKYMLSLRGICSEYVNSSYRILTDEEKSAVRMALREYGFDWAQAT